MEEQISKAVDWEPDVEDWYSGTLDRVNVERSYITVRLGNGELTFVPVQAISVRSSGHYFCLPLGTDMYVRIRRNHGNKLYRWYALEAQVADPDFDPVRDLGALIEWNGTYGIIKCVCGCRLFARANDNAREHLKIGDELEFDVVWNEVHNRFVARNMKVIVDAGTF